MVNAPDQDVDAGAARLAVARRIAASYATVPGIVGVFVGGSVARGWADRWSDVELGIVWASPPTEAQRRDGLLTVPLVRHRVFPGLTVLGALEEEFVVDGIKVDVVHTTVAAIETGIRDVTEAADPDLAKQALLSTMLVSIPLHGHEAIETWRRRSARYPDELSRAMVAKHLAFGPHHYLTMLAERDDLLLLSDILCRVARNVLGVLCGVNRVYPPSADFKWALRLASGLSIAPADLSNRLRHVLRGDPVLAVADAQHLIDETLDHVDLHRPEIDTAPMRARVSQTRAG